MGKFTHCIHAWRIIFILKGIQVINKRVNIKYIKLENQHLGYNSIIRTVVGIMESRENLELINAKNFNLGFIGR